MGSTGKQDADILGATMKWYKDPGFVFGMIVTIILFVIAMVLLGSKIF